MIEYTVKVYDDRRVWWLNGLRHREDGPAIEWHGGSKLWWINGQLHRVDGPAVEWANGTKEWWLNDKLHRTDGPAVEYVNGKKEWWLNGKEVSEKVHRRQTQLVKELTVTEIEKLLGFRVKVVE